MQFICQKFPRFAHTSFSPADVNIPISRSIPITLSTNNQSPRSRCNSLLCAAVLLLVCLSISSCSSSSEPEPATEITKTDGKIVDTPEGGLFLEAQRYYETGMYDLARERFSSLRDSYPYGPYAEYAEVKIADAHFVARDFSAAAAVYEGIVEDHTAGSAGEYVLLQAARSHLLSSRGAGRDITPLEKALTRYDQFLETYPNSVYAPSAYRGRAEAIEQLASHQKLVRDFYKRRELDEAYRFRANLFEEQWKPLLEESQDELQMASRSLSELPVSQAKAQAGMPGAAPAVVRWARVHSGSLSGSPSPQFSEQKEAEELLRSATPKVILISRKQGQDHSSADNKTLFVRSVQCPTESEGPILIHLSASVPPNTLRKVYLGEDSRVLVPLPLGAAETASFDCKDRGRISIRSDGFIAVDDAQSVRVIELSNPPRLAFYTR